MENVVMGEGKRMFAGSYQGRVVFVTGHTGFKGSWLTLWLSILGAKVVGYSRYLPSSPCMYEACGLRAQVSHVDGDVRDMESLHCAMASHRPAVVFHLAAQPLVRESYRAPRETIETNVLGTVNVLECLRRVDSIEAAVLVTSDKCYENREWPWGYRESDRLGGKDPYSASKACAEIVTRAYMQSFLTELPHAPRVATARAGNVIGGGDWAADRIVPDAVRALADGHCVHVRNPMATRPWQHVLEPLAGYLQLGSSLLRNVKGANLEAFNFGPVPIEANRPVRELVEEILRCWGKGKWEHPAEALGAAQESGLLQLCCEKAHQVLGCRAILSFAETVRLTVEWYRQFYAQAPESMLDVSTRQIREYMTRAECAGLGWAQA